MTEKRGSIGCRTSQQSRGLERRRRPKLYKKASVRSEASLRPNCQSRRLSSAIISWVLVVLQYPPKAANAALCLASE